LNRILDLTLAGPDNRKFKDSRRPAAAQKYRPVISTRIAKVV
jgi:hypothetical protein